MSLVQQINTHTSQPDNLSFFWTNAVRRYGCSGRITGNTEVWLEPHRNFRIADNTSA
jgi:hypothetical protein